ncbi:MULTISPECIES: gpW family protein [Yersinia]|uniref:gpW family protein n=1 Tax=Yersinia TaxID=629 RepID=UPI001F55E9BD|nr:gpW family protein [Yersinia enterocolitica]EKN3715713.1 phage head-tail adapter protein [Yersinia enterocolitica]EKN3987772.1 phage head-tail adapter protein [Yersinia enterocolitica]EKN4117260.1 phage head-tail adapter protein [Yersinia enterocolitica]EKN5944407.1 phage head-tail adapter protein [Yersinia enterocolitica]EKN6357063.1 phage head-tail adapter protein [Yersinia enterocolitica]
MFDPNSSLLAGDLTREQLRSALTLAQQAYLELSTGAKGVSFSYAQGDGTRSVSYQPTDIGQLTSLIQLLQAQLGVVSRPRRTLRFRY